jgi:hypothetical protein
MGPGMEAEFPRLGLDGRRGNPAGAQCSNLPVRTAALAVRRSDRRLPQGGTRPNPVPAFGNDYFLLRGPGICASMRFFCISRRMSSRFFSSCLVRAALLI